MRFMFAVEDLDACPPMVIRTATVCRFLIRGRHLYWPSVGENRANQSLPDLIECPRVRGFEVVVYLRGEVNHTQRGKDTRESLLTTGSVRIYRAEQGIKRQGVRHDDTGHFAINPNCWTMMASTSRLRPRPTQLILATTPAVAARKLNSARSSRISSMESILIQSRAGTVSRPAPVCFTIFLRTNRV
jgi:hypothetical protein